MLIANTTHEKFLQSILAEQQKTNEFLAQLLESLRPIAKDTEPKKEVKPKLAKLKTIKPKTDKPKRGNTNVKTK